MNLAPHRALESVVDEALPLDGSLALELHRDDDGPEMAAAIASTCVPGMQMAFVDHFDMYSRESIAQRGFDPRTPIR